jgi:hypothetical protein
MQLFVLDVSKTFAANITGMPGFLVNQYMLGDVGSLAPSAQQHNIDLYHLSHKS